MAAMRIDITSDITCPFCVIGVKQLLTAIDIYKTTHPHDEFNIRFLPYQLNPEFSETPISRLGVLESKLGKDMAQKAMTFFPEKFESVGLKCDFTGPISSTHLAHRLQTYCLCRHPAAQLPLALDIFEGFHCDKKHPSDRPWLASLAVKHGIFETKEKGLEWLKGTQCDQEVKMAYGTARKLGVTGVPFFTFPGRYAASGAMGVEQFVKVLEEVGQREKSSLDKSAFTAVGGETCLVDDKQDGKICDGGICAPADR